MHPAINELQRESLKKVPEIKAGYTVRVHQKIKEGNKERVQIFEGLVIKVSHGQGVEKNITVRRIIQGIGVEKIFPIHSLNITKIEVKKKAKVRRAKLYYMRDRSGKSARLQEHHVTEKEQQEDEARMEAYINEAVEADKKKKKEEAVATGAEEAVNEDASAEDNAETEEAPVEVTAESSDESPMADETAKEGDEATAEQAPEVAEEVVPEEVESSEPEAQADETKEKASE